MRRERRRSERATIGDFPYDRKPLVTSSDDRPAIGAFLRARTRYSTTDVIEYLLGAPAGEERGTT